MGHVDYDDLSDDVQMMIAELQTHVHELQFESNIYRWATLFVGILFIERVWDRMF